VVLENGSNEWVESILLLVRQIPEAQLPREVEQVDGRHARLTRPRDGQVSLLLFLFIPRHAGGGMPNLEGQGTVE
jgi:hypothetical protein